DLLRRDDRGLAGDAAAARRRAARPGLRADPTAARADGVVASPDDRGDRGGGDRAGPQPVVRLGAAVQLDIRLPIGLMFSILGPILLATGESLALRTGGAMTAFGVIMLIAGVRGQRAAKR